MEKKYTLDKIQRKIPQNENNFFIIKKGDWNFSIDVVFNHNEKINLINLYTILKSYFYSDIYLLKFCLIISIDIDNEKNKNTYHNLEIKKIKKMSFFDFENFYYSLYNNDFQYIAKNQYYGFRLVFFKESFFWKNELIYPIYPWNESPLWEEISSLINNDVEIYSIVHKLETLNDNLKKEIIEKNKIIEEKEKIIEEQQRIINEKK